MPVYMLLHFNHNLKNRANEERKILDLIVASMYINTKCGVSYMSVFLSVCLSVCLLYTMHSFSSLRIFTGFHTGARMYCAYVSTLKSWGGKLELFLLANTGNI
jgi:hypothetical protein